jgi:acylpyruvate hydrolase
LDVGCWLLARQQPRTNNQQLTNNFMKIICIGRNYVEHALELKNEVPTEPVFFMKPDTAVPIKNFPFFIPEFSSDIHHEVELVIKINRVGKNIAEVFAHRYYDEISVGVDFTARDIQQRQKEKGLPWEPAKAFDGSAPVGEFIPFSSIKDKHSIPFHLEINGKTVQSGTSDLMIYSFDKIIAHISKYITLKKGDLIFTGTPKGVGRVNTGDKLECFLEDKKLLTVNVK